MLEHLICKTLRETLIDAEGYPSIAINQGVAADVIPGDYAMSDAEPID
jgi:hypothetical protein